MADDLSMTPDAYEVAALSLPGAVLDIKWGSDRCYCIGGKMFAAAGGHGEPPTGPSFKASDLAFEMLVEQGLARPAPYAARAKWVQLLSYDVMPDEQMKAYLAQAHAIVAAKLTRKARAELGIG
jgi:predicted DNA-binding protein (MmcQ/YjbR family)